MNNFEYLHDFGGNRIEVEREWDPIKCRFTTEETEVPHTESPGESSLVQPDQFPSTVVDDPEAW